MEGGRPAFFPSGFTEAGAELPLGREETSRGAEHRHVWGSANVAAKQGPSPALPGWGGLSLLSRLKERVKGPLHTEHVSEISSC